MSNRSIMKTNIKGNVTIKISDDKMKAFIEYQPSKDLFEWSDDSILALLKKAGVKKGYKIFNFSRILKKIEKSPNYETIEVATGLKPLSAELAKYKIHIKHMPFSLEAVYQNLLGPELKPVVYPVIEEYFLDEEASSKSFDLLNYFYVNKGDLVITIDKEEKPLEGYTVTGDVLTSSSEDKQESFCLNKHFKIDKEKCLIYANKSGFVQMGKDWIDLIPFNGHSMSVSPSDDFSEYFLMFKPGNEDVPVPVIDDILGMFSDIDYPLDRLKSEEKILEIINQSILEGKPVKATLTQKRKAVSNIDINPSKTKASLILEKGAGPGEKLSLQYIGSLIRESKIKGMNLESLKKTILSFYKSKELTLNYTILEGKTATRGDDRSLNYQKEFISVDKIEGIVERITDEIVAFYPSFKFFNKEEISSAITVKKGFVFALLSDPVPGDDGIDIYGHKIKGITGNDPIINTFENISVTQNKYISSIDGILDLGEINGETYLRVREHKDMFVDVTISKDAMNASFTFFKEHGSGEKASLEFIKKQIEDAGVVKGIDDTIVEDSYNRYINGELVSEVVFAYGEIPTDKRSSRIKFFNNEGKTKFATEVEKGTTIAQIFPSKEKAADGFDVLGTIMESSGVISLDLNIGDFILEEKQEDDTVLLRSDINGELKVDENNITIIDKKVLSSDVSIKTGSIKTLCSLVIKGSVLSSLYVVSGGNIKIMGTVQGALVSADKNIIIGQGVKGENKAVLRAKEKIDVKFIEKANMMAVDDIHIRKAALHTKIISNGKIVFDKNGSKVVGGETFTKKGISVDVIGSPSGSKTIISFGQDYLVADKIKVFEGDVGKIQEDLMKIENILLKSSGHINHDKITNLRKQKVFLMKKLEKKNMKLFLLKEKFEEHAESEVVVRNKVYPGVIFESHGRILEIMDEESMCKIIFNPNTGQIEKS